MKKCALWNCNYNYFLYTLASINSFIETNKWFVEENNDILIVISDPISNDDIQKSKKIYKNINFIYLPNSNVNRWFVLEHKFKEQIGEHAINSNRHKQFFCMFNRFVCFDILPNYEFVMQVETDILFNNDIQHLFSESYPILNCQMLSDIEEGIALSNNEIISHIDLNNIALKYTHREKPIFGQLGLTIFHNSISNILNYEKIKNVVDVTKFPWIYTTNYDEECFNIYCGIKNLHDKYFYVNVNWIKYVQIYDKLYINTGSVDNYNKDDILFTHYISKPWSEEYDKNDNEHFKIWHDNYFATLRKIKNI